MSQLELQRLGNNRSAAHLILGVGLVLYGKYQGCWGERLFAGVLPLDGKIVAD